MPTNSLKKCLPAPCPRCGASTAPPYVALKERNGYILGWVACPACGLQGEHVRGATREQACQDAKLKWARMGRLGAVPRVD